jgi:hypothetical protein
MFTVSGIAEFDLHENSVYYSRYEPLFGLEDTAVCVTLLQD